MTRLVALARWDGEITYVNVNQIIHVTPAPPAKSGDARSTITFALLRWTDGTDHGALTETFCGTPGDIAALLLMPLGAAPEWVR